MARVRDFDRTRTLLIRAASELFGTQGYDRTSVDRIIRQAGVSKGAFYHHFSSKEEILDAVTASIVSDLMNVVRSAIGDRSVSAIVRLNRFLDSSSMWKLAHFGLVKEVFAVLYRDENAKMLRKIQTYSVDVCAPPLAEILEQGIDEGVFDLPRPRDVARLFMQLGLGVQADTVRTMLESGMTDKVLATLLERGSLFLEMAERMIGAPKGSIQLLPSLDTLRSEGLELVGEMANTKAGAS